MRRESRSGRLDWHRCVFVGQMFRRGKGKAHGCSRENQCQTVHDVLPSLWPDREIWGWLAVYESLCVYDGEKLLQSALLFCNRRCGFSTCESRKKLWSLAVFE